MLTLLLLCSFLNIFQPYARVSTADKDQNPKTQLVHVKALAVVQ